MALWSVKADAEYSFTSLFFYIEMKTLKKKKSFWKEDSYLEKKFLIVFFNLANLENEMFFFIYLKRRCEDKKIAKYWIYWEYFSILFFFIYYIEKILFGYWNLWTWFVKFSFWKKIQVKIYHFILRKFWIIIME